MYIVSPLLLWINFAHLARKNGHQTLDYIHIQLISQQLNTQHRSYTLHCQNRTDMKYNRSFQSCWYKLSCFHTRQYLKHIRWYLFREIKRWSMPVLINYTDIRKTKSMFTSFTERPSKTFHTKATVPSLSVDTSRIVLTAMGHPCTFIDFCSNRNM